MIQLTRRSLAAGLASLALVFATIAGCGGGVGTGGTGTHTTTSFTYGQITGFGSIIVNGVRFDDSAASVVDDRGGSRSRDELKLGMTVGVSSDDIVNGTTGREARAGVVRFGSVLEAIVTNVDTVGGTLVALGQTVRVTATTVFDDSLAGGLAGVSVGSMIEVHGYIDAATNTIVATRIEGTAASTTHKARGVVTAVNTAARTFQMGAATFSYATAMDAPANLAAGQQVTVYVQSTPSAGAWVVTSFSTRAVSRPSDDLGHADIRGIVTSFTDARHFVLNDTPVDATNATFPDGTAFGQGSRVKVEGGFVSGTLVASKVELETEDEIQGEGIDLRGAIESVDAAAQTFRLRGSTVFYGGSVRYENGSASNLATGRNVRVRGKLAADRTRVNAEEIKFE